MKNENRDLPMLGKTIPWSGVAGAYLRALHFTPFQSGEGTRVSGPSVLGARGVVTVEGPRVGQVALLPVFHRENFRNLWWAFNTRTVAASEELMIVYLPARFFLKRLFAGRLYVEIYPKGTLEKMARAFFDHDVEMLRNLPGAIERIAPPGRDRLGGDGPATIDEL